MSLDVSVIICSYNRSNILIRALKALFAQDFPADRYEIVVIDDGSTDGTADAVKKIEHPCGLKYLYQENSGLSIGRNKGVKAAEGKIVIFVDDDIIATESFISEHFKIHEKEHKCIGRGPVIHVSDMDNPTKGKPLFNLQDISNAYFWTSNVSVKKEHIEEVGLFDESFKEYGWEDLELGQRLKKLGLKRRISKKAAVYHYKGAWKKSDLPGLLRQSRAKARTALIYLKKHPVNHTKMSTGVHPAIILLYKMLEMGGAGRRLCQKIIESQKDGELGMIPKIFTKLLCNFEYYNTISEEMQKE